MKSIFKFITAAMMAAVAAQPLMAAPPKLLILPDKTWCVEKGYFTETTRNGKTVQREDYDRALIDPDYKNVSLAIAQIMAERQFPVIDAASQQESDDEDEMFDEAFEGAQTGASAATNAYDELLKRAKPDITLKIGWNAEPNGSYNALNYRLEAIDSYSNKSVAPISGSGQERRTTPLSMAIKTIAKGNMDNFCQTLMDYFESIQKNGREIRVDVRILDSAGITMNDEFDGKELSEIINDWIEANTVNNQYSRRSSGRNMARYDQVMMSYKNSKGKPQDAAMWLKGLVNELKTYGIVAENASTGLGAGRIYIGEK